MSRVRRLATRVLVTAVALSAFGALSAPAAHADPLCAGANASVLGAGVGYVPCVPTPFGTLAEVEFSDGDPSLVWVYMFVSVPSRL